MFFFNKRDKSTDTKLNRPGYEPLSDEHAEYLKSLVIKAGEIDVQREVFGSSQHQYRLNPVLSIEEVRQHDEKQGTRLPEEYVFFLTKVGNGGAGPYYGVYPLERIEAHLPREGLSGQPAWISSTLSKETWAKAMEDLEHDEIYDAEMEKICSGTHVIGTQGCTYDHLLMNNGAEQGQIVIMDWNLEPENPPFFTGMTFLEWYEHFFLEIISGHHVTSYGYVRLGTEEQLITDFGQADDEGRLEILRSFSRFNKVSDASLHFLLELDDRKLDAARLELLLRLQPKMGMTLFNDMLNGSNLQAAARAARLIPKQSYNSYYQPMLQLLYSNGLPDEQADFGSCKQRVLYFLQECSSLSALDLQDFAMSDSQPEEERKTAIYVMGKAADKLRCLESFIGWMRGDSYWLAHTALQAMARTASEHLLETYEWMWSKYNHDERMKSNLRIAFKANGIEK